MHLFCFCFRDKYVHSYKSVYIYMYMHIYPYTYVYMCMFEIHNIHRCESGVVSLKQIIDIAKSRQFLENSTKHSRPIRRATSTDTCASPISFQGSNFQYCNFWSNTPVI